TEHPDPARRLGGLLAAQGPGRPAGRAEEGEGHEPAEPVAAPHGCPGARDARDGGREPEAEHEAARGVARTRRAVAPSRGRQDRREDERRDRDRDGAEPEHEAGQLDEQLEHEARKDEQAHGHEHRGAQAAPRREDDDPDDDARQDVGHQGRDRRGDRADPQLQVEQRAARHERLGGEREKACEQDDAGATLRGVRHGLNLAPGGPGAGHLGAGQSLISQMTVPAETEAPTLVASERTVPERCATRGCSIFIASSTTTRSPSLTWAPSSTAILTIVPCIGEARVLPFALTARAPLLRRAARRGAAPGRRPPTARPAGMTTSRRLPPTSTVTRSTCGSPSSAGVGPLAPRVLSRSANSVSIHRVCTAKGWSGSAGAKSASPITARWKGTTVAMPSTSSSASARRARSSACRRSAPVTMSFAIIESKAPETVSPSTTPESTRTPGPAGRRRREIRPGVGRKPAAGSSPLIRNSIEWPRTATSL